MCPLSSSICAWTSEMGTSWRWETRKIYQIGRTNQHADKTPWNTIPFYSGKNHLADSSNFLTRKIIFPLKWAHLTYRNKKDMTGESQFYWCDTSGVLPGLRQQHTSTCRHYLQQVTLLAVSRSLVLQRRWKITSKNSMTFLHSAQHLDLLSLKQTRAHRKHVAAF